MPEEPSKTRSQLATPLGVGALSLTVCTQLSEVASAHWDALLEPDDAPLLSWGYLQGLEESGCVGEATGWLPAHLLLRISDGARAGELVAAAPAYIKANSDGEWVYDFDWAEFAESRGLAYYPKLVLAVPFNPVTGGRLLTHPELPAAERQALRGALLRAARTLCRHAGLSSAHVLFPRGPGFAGPPGGATAPEAVALPPETTVMPAGGFLLRQQEQYHFLNDGYRTFDDYLDRLRSHRRSGIRRERRELAAAGITVRTHRGLHAGPVTASLDRGFTAAELDRVFDMYFETSQRYTGGPPFLNRRFFQLCAERLGDRLELVLARDRTGLVIGGAWNLRGDRRLYGRYWGRSADAENAEPVPFLHFEVCFYHSIERCIAAGLAAFEPGHGGDQKLVRGFTPSYTYSAHYLADARLRAPIEAFLQYETPLVEDSIRAATLRSNLRAPAPVGPKKEAGARSAKKSIQASAKDPANEPANEPASDPETAAGPGRKDEV